MHPLKTNTANMLASLRGLWRAGSLGPAGVVLGILLVALGWILEEQFIGAGAVVRTLGGVLFLCGLAIVVFGDSHRRVAAIGAAERIYARYMARTAHWGWPDRWGLAGVVIGFALVVPALVLQIIFRNGVVIAAPAVVIFWAGVFLLIYGRFHRRGQMRDRGLPSSPPRTDRCRGGRLG